MSHATTPRSPRKRRTKSPSRAEPQKHGEGKTNQENPLAKGAMTTTGKENSSVRQSRGATSVVKRQLLMRQCVIEALPQDVWSRTRHLCNSSADYTDFGSEESGACGGEPRSPGGKKHFSRRERSGYLRTDLRGDDSSAKKTERAENTFWCGLRPPAGRIVSDGGDGDDDGVRARQT
jgi:hypothetical protein